MAEDEADIQDQNEEDEEDVVGRRIRKEHKENQNQKKCNSRIEQLATPNRRYFLALWEEHAHHFEKERVEKLKAKLQELYAMTPEETEKYFERLRAEMKRRTWQKYMKDKMKKIVAKQKRMQKQKKAYAFFKKLLKQVLHYAFTNDTPIFVSYRLRLLSDIILEQLCDLRAYEVPERDSKDKLDKFLISVADWFAIGVENMYFLAQVKKNEELEEIERDIEVQRQSKKEKEIETETKRVETPTGSTDFQPPLASTPQQSQEEITK